MKKLGHPSNVYTRPAPSQDHFMLLIQGQITSEEYVRRIRAETRHRMRERPPSGRPVTPAVRKWWRSLVPGKH